MTTAIIVPSREIIEYSKIIVNALTLIAGLAWNSAFQKTFESIEALHLYGPWIYAFLITLLCIFIIACIRAFLIKYFSSSL